jgi:hypothetical protein
LRKYRFFVIPLALSVLGCSADHVTAPATRSGGDGRMALEASLFKPAPTIDEEFERVARDSIKGFAGEFLDETGTPTVLLTDLAQAPKGLARAAHLGAFQKGGVNKAPVARRVRYDFLALMQWRDSVAAGIGRDLSRVAVDIDEVHNQVWFGYEDASVGERIKAVINERKIPGGAVVAELTKLPHERQTLINAVSPAVAGIQIVTDIPGGFNTCTLGYNVLYQGNAAFVTASHCTYNYGGVDGHNFYQPCMGCTLLGAEVWDRAAYTGCTGLPWYAGICRWSDASIIQYDAGASSSLGVIAWPSQTYGGRGSLEIGDPPSLYGISTKWTTSIPVGASVGKVGRTSGNTSGTVTKSCVTKTPNNCVYVTNVWSEGGDSGAPFLLFSIPNPGAGIAGQLWGGPPGVYTETWFTTLNGLERDLGSTLTVCIPGWGC